MKGIRIAGLVLWLLISIPAYIIWRLIDMVASGVSAGNWYNAILGGLGLYIVGGLMGLLALFLFVGGVVWIFEG